MLDTVSKKLLLLVFLLTAFSIARAQNLYFEPLLGTASTDYTGNNLISDSIRVVTSGGDHEGIRELRLIGVNVGYPFTPRFDLQSNLTFSIINPSYRVYNETSTCTFCPIEKTGGQTFTDIQLGVTPRFVLVNFGNLKLLAFVGSTVHFNIRKSSGYTPVTDFNGKWQTVAKVLNAIDEASGETFFSFSYGGAIYYKKISLSVKYTENISNTITSNLEVEGISYPFYNDFNRLSISLAYQFYFRKEKDN